MLNISKHQTIENKEKVTTIAGTKDKDVVLHSCERESDATMRVNAATDYHFTVCESWCKCTK